MFYLIHKETGKVKEEASSKGKLRRIQKTMENGKDFKVSKFKPGSTQMTKTGVKQVRSDGTRQKGFSARFTPEQIIRCQERINERRINAGLKVIVPVPTVDEINKRRSRGFDIEGMDAYQEKMSGLVKKFGQVLNIGGEDVPVGLSRREKRRTRTRKKTNYDGSFDAALLKLA